MLGNIVVIVIGLILSIMLFNEFPMLKNNNTSKSKYKISIIIPARNEEENIRVLLQDLMPQKDLIHEIICVDDGSVDETYKVALSFNVTAITIVDKQEDWTGKAWACQVGANAATGDILLFLDADVRLGPNEISNLINSYDKNKCVISVQPYHKTEKYYEQFSFFFNIVQIYGIGMTSGISKKHTGLCGPVILIDRETYSSIGGHSSVKSSIVDDLALAEKLTEMNFSYKLFMGGDNISFRMYGNGFKSLYQGWTKNYATGALKTPVLIFTLAFLWITSCLTTPIIFIQSIINFTPVHFIIAIGLYICWIFELFRISKRIGSFKKLTIIIFPIYLVFFIVIFFVSLCKKIFKLDVSWKGRKVKLD